MQLWCKDCLPTLINCFLAFANSRILHKLHTRLLGHTLKPLCFQNTNCGGDSRLRFGGDACCSWGLTGRRLRSGDLPIPVPFIIRFAISHLLQKYTFAEVHELTVSITDLGGAGGTVTRETQNTREMFNLFLHKNGKEKKHNWSSFVMEISSRFTLFRYV